MFNEKERQQLNRYLTNQTFLCDVPFFSFDAPKYQVEYIFNIVGERKMISVGEYYMYDEVDIEIIDIEEKYKLYFNLMGSNFDKDRILKVFFQNEYTFNNSISQCVSENLKYFTDGDYPRVIIKNITMSNELYENIMNKKTEDTA